MKPSVEEILQTYPDLDRKITEEHIECLGRDYFRKFSLDEIRTHIKSISKLSPANPVEVNISRKMVNNIECCVTAYDFPSEFSLITGLLAGMGFNIESGDVYTYKEIKKTDKKAEKKKRETSESNRRKIVDYFFGSLETGIPFEEWEKIFKENLESVISLLDTGDEDSIKTAKNMVNKMVVQRLSKITGSSGPVLYPVAMEIDNITRPYTWLKIVSEDTFAFMYTLSNALALHNIRIEHVRIRTIRGRVEDTIDLLDSRGNKIVDQTLLEEIKLSVLLTKQFTCFLSNAPDPYTALSRFDILIKDIIDQPFRDEWTRHLTDPENLMNLARLLGTSDFLWEDFIRLQYESLFTVFKKDSEKRMHSRSAEEIESGLKKVLEEAHTIEDKKKQINRFKDREAFLIDLDHILNPELGFRFLADKLTGLAELVVNTASELVYDDLVKKYGEPCSVAGLNVRYSIMGLGKLGGMALGYASDIELLFVYSDNGKTDGERSIDNSEFFNLLVKGIYQFIRTKREGIFQVDLRLRPHGSSGPLACSMESFCSYYGRGGQAHAYELISLVRMRPIGGDPDLGKQLERIRDHIIYMSNNIDFKALRNLREKQFREKSDSKRINAKYSPGGLVDLEYGVQTLQVMYGKNVEAVRTTRIHEALKALNENGFMPDDDCLNLLSDYDFLRELINGLRMLRGNALDLFLPPADTDEFMHLARRMGYRSEEPVTSAQKLFLDLETHMARVRYFAEKYFGIESLPSLESGTVVDIIFSENMPANVRNSILSKGGITNLERAYVNLKHLAGNGSRRDAFSRLIVLAWDIIKRTPDPDMALNNWERFIRSTASPEFHYNILMSQPMQLEILLSIFSNSQFLSDTLVRNPGFLEWVIDPELLRNIRKIDDLESELRTASHASGSEREWLNKLRRFRRREILRIGIRDICLGVSTRTIMLELSMLADSIVRAALGHRLRKARGLHYDKSNEADTIPFCIMAFGKLGGNELNYSSDIDLIGVYENENTGEKTQEGNKEIFTRVMEQVCADLNSHTEEGYVYRVDLRLRPFGRSGELIHSLKGLTDYYNRSASLWEIQAAMKLRPLAGNMHLGQLFLDSIKPFILQNRDNSFVFKEIEKMRNFGIKRSSRSGLNIIDVKSGIGGIRDVEFLVQGLQLLHAVNNENLINGNTMMSIEELFEDGILSEEEASTLKKDYIFLRRVEHYLQILEDRQTHAIPKEKKEIKALAKRILGVDTHEDSFLELLNACLRRIRSLYNHVVIS